jgi:hypothetical protein
MVLREVENVMEAMIGGSEEMVERCIGCHEHWALCLVTCSSSHGSGRGCTLSTDSRFWGWKFRVWPSLVIPNMATMTLLNAYYFLNSDFLWNENLDFWSDDDGACPLFPFWKGLLWGTSMRRGVLSSVVVNVLLWVIDRCGGFLFSLFICVHPQCLSTLFVGVEVDDINILPLSKNIRTLILFEWRITVKNTIGEFNKLPSEIKKEKSKKMLIRKVEYFY